MILKKRVDYGYYFGRLLHSFQEEGREYARQNFYSTTHDYFSLPSLVLFLVCLGGSSCVSHGRLFSLLGCHLVGAAKGNHLDRNTTHSSSIAYLGLTGQEAEESALYTKFMLVKGDMIRVIPVCFNPEKESCYCCDLQGSAPP